MEYEACVREVSSIPMFSKNPGINALEHLLGYIGNPQDKCKTIHIAGTNGKGSVAAFLSAILSEAGYKVGMFSSPHLIKINERIAINGEMISDDDFVSMYIKVCMQIEAAKQTGIKFQCTYFELLFLMAVTYFEIKQVDFAIYETGMGGRLDATNVVDPIVSIITSIGHDHTKYLGNTPKEIAREKAGIIKSNVPVVALKSNVEIGKVIEDIAKQKQAPCYFVEKKDYIIYEMKEKTIDFSFDSSYDRYGKWQIAKTGLYQVENAVLAIQTVKILQNIGYTINKNVIKKGLLNMQWEGRMQQIDNHIYVDGAHNEEAILAFVQTLKELHQDKKKVLLFAVAQDKDYEKMIYHLCRDIPYEHIAVTAIEHTRSVPTETVACIFKKYMDNVSMYPTVSEAFENTKKQLQGDESLFCVGSLYLVGELLEQHRRKCYD